jgi:IPT/TIG domain
MTTSPHRGVLLLAFAIGRSACDVRSPSGPSSQPPAASSARGVTAISPSLGSTVRPTPVMISGTGFLAGAAVTIDVIALRVIVVNNTTITAIAPARAAEPADVVVTNSLGSS